MKKIIQEFLFDETNDTEENKDILYKMWKLKNIQRELSLNVPQNLIWKLNR